MDKLKKYLIYSYIFLIGISCQKQKPDVDSGFTRTLAERQRLEACSHIDLANNLLDYGNTINLFQCFAWNKQFPSLYQAVKDIDESSWNHVFGPIDAVFLNDKVRRDRFFGHIRDLDAKGGLDDLSFVMTALNETNFFDGLREMFLCIESPNNKDCDDRKGRIPARQDIEKVIELVNVEPINFHSVSELIKIFLKAVGEEAEPLRHETNKFFHLPLFKTLRLRLISAVSNKILDGEGMTDRDKKVLLDFILSAKEGTLNPWIYEWLNDEKMTEESFSKLLRFPIDRSPYLIRDLKAMEMGFEQGVACESYENDNYVEINLKVHLSEYLQDLVKSNYNEFFRLSLKNINTLQTATAFCPILTGYSPRIDYIDPRRNGEIVRGRHSVDFHNVLNRISELFLDKSTYEITKFLFKVTEAERETGKLPGARGVPLRDKLYLVGLAMGDIAGYGNEFNKVVGINSRDYYKILFRIAKRMEVKAFLHAGDLTTEVFKEEHRERFKAVARMWKFFSDEEKNFLFRFIDRHLVESTNYLLLFDFYAKMLDELPTVAPQISKAWTGNQEKMDTTYNSLFDLVDKLSGNSVLKDFQNFFSRDHVVRILEILSKGEQFQILALEEYNYVLNDYVRKRMQESPFYFDWSGENEEDAARIATCIQDMENEGGTFYVVANRLPRSCEKVRSSEMSLRIYKWLSFINQDYQKQTEINTINRGDAPVGLFDQDGLFASAVLNSNVISSIVLNEIFDRDGKPEYINGKARYDGLSYLLDSFHHHIYVLKHIEDGKEILGYRNELNESLRLADRLIKTNYESHQIFRASVTKAYVKKENFDRTKEVVENGLDVFEDYLQWVLSGERERIETRSLGVYDPQYSCQNFLNTKVESLPVDHTCPSPEIIKRVGTKLIARHYVVHEREFGSPLSQLAKALIPDGRLIPLDAKKPKRHHISLQEALTFLYDLTAPDLAINKTTIPFIGQDGKKREETLNTMQRIDMVIRDSGFKLNYLGVQYMNDVAHTDNYNKTVIAKKKLLEKCSKIPLARCGKKMSDGDKRLVKNILATYDGLLDANNGRGKEARFKYGDFMRALLGSMVGSSAKKAQKVRFLPLSDKNLARHNGVILVETSRLTAPSNAGRVLNDRIGRTREDFESFINSKPFQMVNRSFMRGFNLFKTQWLLESLAKKVIIADRHGQSLFDYSVDWLASLNYEELRLVEDTAARLLWLGAYLGSPTFVFPERTLSFEDRALGDHYASNNIFGIFQASEKLIEMWPALRESFVENEYDLMKLIRKANSLLYFFTENISKDINPADNKYYRALNDGFLLLDNLFFKSHADSRIVGGGPERFQGLDFFVSFVRKMENVKALYQGVENIHGYIDRLYYKTAEMKVLTDDFFKKVIKNIRKVFNEERLDAEPLRLYLSVTSKNALCFEDDILCQGNFHYDEPASIVSYLTNIHDESGKSYFDVLTDTLLIEEKENFLDFYNEISSYLILRKY